MGSLVQLQYRPILMETQSIIEMRYLTTAELKDVVVAGTASSWKDAVAYVGSVRQHPYDETRLLVITTREQEDSHFYEFRKKDLVAIDALNEVVNSKGDTIQILRIGIKKGSRGVEMKPFEVS